MLAVLASHERIRLVGHHLLFLGIKMQLIACTDGDVAKVTQA